MEYLKYGALITLFCFFMTVNISASSVQYNDIVVPEDYSIKNSDFDNINLKVNNNNVDINSVDIDPIGNDKYSLSFSDGTFNFDAIVQIQRVDNISGIQAGQNHYLEVDDDDAIASNNASEVYCNVISGQSETVNVSTQVSQTSGISESVLKCDSLYIDSYSDVNIVSSNEFSNYTINQQDILYAEDFAYSDDIVNISDQKIIELANVDSTYSSSISVTQRNKDNITFTDGLSTVTVEVLEDEAPKLNKEKYYMINQGEEVNYNSLFDVTDDYDKEFEFDSDINTSKAGIYVETLSIKDSVNNETKEEVLVIVDDGTYNVTSNERYIYQTKDFVVMSNEEYITVNMYDINAQEYIDMNIKIFNQKEDENLEIIPDDQISNIYMEEHETEIQTKDYTYLYIIIAVVILIGIGFLF